MDILPQVLMNGIILGSVIALIALGLSLIYGVLGFMNFAHGELAMLGAFFYYFFYIMLGWAIIPSFIAALILCGIVGAVFNKLIFHPLRRESAWTLLITSIGVSLFIKASVLLIAGGRSRNYIRDDFEPHVIKLLNESVIITNTQIILIASTFILLFGVIAFLKYSKTGKAIRAVSDNMEVAAILGIDVKKTINKIFILSSLLAGFAGVLIAYEQNLSPNMGMWLSIAAFSAVVLGGLGSIGGAVVGGMIIGILSNVMVGIEWGGFTIPTNYKSIVAFTVLILVLLIRPRGLFGKKLEEEARK